MRRRTRRNVCQRLRMAQSQTERTLSSLAGRGLRKCTDIHAGRRSMEPSMPILESTHRDKVKE
jgi:hypothetical protein